MVSKLLYRVFKAITIAIISQGSRLGVMAIQSFLQRYCTVANICITDLLYPLDLLIFG